MARSKTTRVLNGERQALFGGYVTWEGRGGIIRTKEVRVWASARIDETDCGVGTATIVKLIEAKHGKGTAREVWRYS